MDVLTLCEKVAEAKEELKCSLRRKKLIEQELEAINSSLDSLKSSLRGYIEQLQEGVHYDISDIDDLTDEDTEQ